MRILACSVSLGQGAQVFETLCYQTIIVLCQNLEDSDVRKHSSNPGPAAKSPRAGFVSKSNLLWKEAP